VLRAAAMGWLARWLAGWLLLWAARLDGLLLD
jgi:hypothetical protein